MHPSRPVKLTAPAERGSVRLVRILAAGVAADAGLSIDDTEDLRIAVSELVALLVDGVDEEGECSIEIEFGRAAGEVVVDDHTFDAGATGRRFRLVKRARVAS